MLDNMSNEKQHSTKQMIPCYKCGSQNLLGQQFCKVCGARFQYKCPQCGENVELGYRHCPSCEVELDWGMQQEDSLPEIVEITEPEEEDAKADESQRVEGKQRKKPSPWLIAFIAILLCIGAVFAMDAFFRGS